MPHSERQLSASPRNEVFMQTPDQPKEFTPQHFMARLVGADGTALVADDIESITRRVFRRRAEPNNNAIHTKELVVGEAIFDTLQTDGYWQGRDATGYNFRDRIPGHVFTMGGEWYSVQYDIRLAVPSGGSSGEDNRLPVEFDLLIVESIQN